MEWDSHTRYRQQIERRLNEIGSQVKGNQAFGADRIADLIEQIDELRTALAEAVEKQKVMADWLKANCPKCQQKGSTDG